MCGSHRDGSAVRIGHAVARAALVLAALSAAPAVGHAQDTAKATERTGERAPRRSIGAVTVPLVGARAYVAPVWGIHANSAQRFVLTGGVLFEQDSALGCTFASRCQQPLRPVGLVTLTPGLDGLRVSAGGGVLAEPLIGLVGTVSVLRTWRAPVQVEANQTYVGPGVNLLFLGFNVGVTSYWRVAGRSPWQDWFAAFNIGLGI